MLTKMRGSAIHSAMAAAVAALLTSGPANAVGTDEARMETLSQAVATLEEPSQPVFVPSEEPAFDESQADLEPVGTGTASFYGKELAGNRTASGERFDPNGLTAAHRSLPLGTKLKVTNTANGRSVVVRVNDRGPFVKNRMLDVSLGAAHKLNMVRSGTARVVVERVPTI
jgi:rare lipoprotein A